MPLPPCIILFFLLVSSTLAVPIPVPGNPHVLCFLKREAQSIAARMPQGIAERAPQGIAERTPQDIAERTPQGIAERWDGIDVTKRAAEAQEIAEREAQGIAERDGIDVGVGVVVPPVVVSPIHGPPKVPEGEFC